jgi:hypothetical protein
MLILSWLRSRFYWIDVMGQQVTDPTKFRRLNGWLVVFWTIMFPISFGLHLLSLVLFVSLLSIYANWATHLGAWAASRAEARQVEDVDVEANHANVHADEVDINPAPSSSG